HTQIIGPGLAFLQIHHLVDVERVQAPRISSGGEEHGGALLFDDLHVLVVLRVELARLIDTPQVRTEAPAVRRRPEHGFSRQHTGAGDGYETEPALIIRRSNKRKLVGRLIGELVAWQCKEMQPAQNALAGY